MSFLTVFNLANLFQSKQENDSNTKQGRYLVADILIIKTSAEFLKDRWNNHLCFWIIFAMKVFCRILAKTY